MASGAERKWTSKTLKKLDFYSGSVVHMTADYEFKNIFLLTSQVFRGNLISGPSNIWKLENNGELIEMCEMKLELPCRMCIVGHEAFVLDHMGRCFNKINLESKEITKYPLQSTPSYIFCDQNSLIILVTSYFGNNIKAEYWTIPPDPSSVVKGLSFTRIESKDAVINHAKTFAYLIENQSIVRVSMDPSTVIALERYSSPKFQQLRGITISEDDSKLFVSDELQNLLFEVSTSTFEVKELVMHSRKEDDLGLCNPTLLLLNKRTLYVLNATHIEVVYPDAFPWNLQRILWIGKFKNPEIPLSSVPKEILNEIIRLLFVC